MLDVPKSTNMVNEDDVSKGASPVVYRLVLTGGKFFNLKILFGYSINEIKTTLECFFFLTY